MAIIYFITQKEPEKLQAWLHNSFISAKSNQYHCSLELLYIKSINKTYLKLSIPDEIFTHDIYTKLRTTSFTQQFDFFIKPQIIRRTELSPLTWIQRLLKKRVSMK